jgi:WD40 repeat protein/tRNA A-37 threonylcarbamoyl transferase component Bud32
MGTVWMAEQTRPVKRRVALKVIKPGMDSRQILARFEAERQALALMDHPNIAKVLDAGATDAGRPYFVMELVKGQPVTEFCDKNRLTTRERLDLFVAVCNAIQHAHQKGVIHRDIKPTNVLVALYDGKPVPKVIDFGVAKAVGDPLTDKTLFTRHGQVVGTFEYMSPEQANLDQLDIDTRSDVYALGVVLYELLTGTTPLDKERLRQAGLAEVLRLIREEEPPKPSTRLTSTPGLLATTAAHRKTDSQKLPRAVRGELDWIVMKALDKDRNRRFPTANALAADVERFLKGEPVQACPPTLSYRFRKYARKHKVALAAGTAIGAALLVGLALTSWQAVRATNAEHATADEQVKTAGALDDALRIGKELDSRLVDIQAANEKIRRTQAENRANQYAWDMQMLPLTWEDNNAGEARQMLERQIPGPGEKDLRHFEWHYWNRQTHIEHAAFTLPDAEVSIPLRGFRVSEIGQIFSRDGSRAALVFLPFSPRTGVSLSPLIPRGRVKVWDVATRKLLLNYELAEDEGTSGIRGHTWSDDGKVVLLRGTIISKNRPTPGSRGPRGRAGSTPQEGWVRVLEVDGGKVLFDPRKELREAHVSPTAFMSGDGRKLVTHDSEKPLFSREDPEVVFASLRCKVWDLGGADRKPVTIKGAVIRSLSPDGSRLFGRAWVDGKPKSKVWDTATGKELSGMDYLLTPTISGFTFSPNGTLVAVIEIDIPEPEKRGMPTKRQLKVYDTTSGKEVFVDDFGLTPSFWPEPAVLFSPDGSKIAVGKTTRIDIGSVDSRTEWQILDARSGKVLATFVHPGGPELATQFRRAPQFFSDDGTQFILAVANVIHTFDTATGRPVHTLRGCVNQIADMVTLPGGKLRTIEAGCTIRDWNLSRVEPVRTAIVEVQLPANDGRGPPSRPTAVSADGARVAVSTQNTSDDGTLETVHVWDAAGKGSVELVPPRRDRPAGAPFFLGPLQLSANGKRLALLRYERPAPPSVQAEKIDPATLPPPDVTVWDVTRGEIIFQRKFPRSRMDRMDTVVTLSPDGATLAIVYRAEDGDKQKATMTFVDLATGRDGKPIEVEGGIGQVSFSPDGKRVEGTYSSAQNEGGFSTSQIAVWDVATGSRVCIIEDAPPDRFDGRDTLPGFARSKCWSSDGTRLALAGSGGAQLHLFDTTTWKLAKSLDVSNRGGRLLGSFRGSSLAFSPDGRRIACIVSGRFGRQWTVNVLDTESGKELLSLPIPADFVSGAGGGEEMRFTPDGHRLIYFKSATEFPGGAGGAPPVMKSYLRVHTWDATPLPEPKKP